jgi:hypothetical protein
LTRGSEEYNVVHAQFTGEAHFEVSVHSNSSLTALFRVFETNPSIVRILEEDHVIRVQLLGKVLIKADLVLLVREISHSTQCFISKDNLFRFTTQKHGAFNNLVRELCGKE